MLPAFIENNLEWLIAGAIVVFGLLVYGWGDVRRFSPGRAWAISGVCFAESIRRWVILIPILAILGVIGISQFIRGSEQDIIRQSIKYSLFAAGMVVTVTTILLACTNLPREIENRVIYTIVTKPTTRLEIVVGKVLGFARVSLLILVIMGTFTFIFVHAQSWYLRRDIDQRLAAGAIEPLSRPTFEYWRDHGLLSSRTFETPATPQVFAREPDQTSRRWFFGAGDGNFVVPFYLEDADLIPPGYVNAAPGDQGLVVLLHVGFERSLYDPTPESLLAESRPATQPATRPSTAQVVVEFLDQNLGMLADLSHVNGGNPVPLSDPTGAQQVYAHLSPQGTKNLLSSGLFFVSVTGTTPGVEYFVDIAPRAQLDLNPVTLVVPGEPRGRIYGPVNAGSGPAIPLFRGRVGFYGQMLRGGKPERSPVAVFPFRGTQPEAPNGQVPFELKVRIELSGGEGEEDQFSRFEVWAMNYQTGQRSPPLAIAPESNRTTYFTLPAGYLAGGNFDIFIRNLGTGHWVTLSPDALQMVASEETFNGNLLRSLGILWMLSILVVIISICCSTFLSWPIAIVLTLLLLLGHWGIMQVADSLAPGIGNQVAQDIFGAQRAGEARVVSAYIEGMSRVLNQLAKVLPDISRFAAIEDVERGITISRSTMLQPLAVLGAFGLPMLVLSYVFLRNKEVAP